MLQRALPPHTSRSLAWHSSRSTQPPPPGPAGHPAEEPERTSVGNYFISNYPPFSTWGPGDVLELDLVLDNPSPDRELPVYIHLPFCRQRCRYCYFRVHPRPSDETVQAYLEALLTELALYHERRAVRGRAASALYFGGGTPSYLSAGQIDRSKHPAVTVPAAPPR